MRGVLREGTLNEGVLRGGVLNERDITWPLYIMTSLNSTLAVKNTLKERKYRVPTSTGRTTPQTRRWCIHIWTCTQTDEHTNTG